MFNSFFFKCSSQTVRSSGHSVGNRNVKGNFVPPCVCSHLYQETVGGGVGPLLVSDWFHVFLGCDLMTSVSPHVPMSMSMSMSAHTLAFIEAIFHIS